MSTSRPRRIVFGAVSLLVAYAVLELFSLALHAIVFSEPFSYEGLQRERLRQSGVATESLVFDRPRDPENDSNAQAIHPSLGYVLDLLRTPLWPVNQYGFLGDLPPFDGDERTPAEEQLLSLVVLGGSVPETLSTWGRGRCAMRWLGSRRFAVVRCSSRASRFAG